MSFAFKPLFLWNITCSTPNCLASLRFARDAYPPSNATRCGGCPYAPTCRLSIGRQCSLSAGLPDSTTTSSTSALRPVLRLILCP